MLYIFTSVWVLNTPKLVKNLIFNIFNSKKLKKKKKQQICNKFLQKMSFLSMHQNAGWVFYFQQKQVFSWCKLKNPILLSNVVANLLLFQLFAIKYVKNKDFNMHLECSATKRWSKYTTNTTVSLQPIWNDITQNDLR